MALTDAVVQQAKATGKDYTIMMQMDSCYSSPAEGPVAHFGCPDVFNSIPILIGNAREGAAITAGNVNFLAFPWLFFLYFAFAS
ncbi:hypothetical protein PCO86_19265 [Pectobacteriaceae bacterium CE70]|nr:hypothetical protein PCO87_20025 [Pectobacteriaceae bacterium C52]WJV66374.1 hypothetical protein PCO86_19265 [Pectobacteriaceae bacterium CE70]WJY10380.1 hypothetical protein PCO80_19225 [Pectobacteriaceae bacterium C80]